MELKYLGTPVTASITTLLILYEALLRRTFNRTAYGIEILCQSQLLRLSLFF